MFFHMLNVHKEDEIRCRNIQKFCPSTSLLLQSSVCFCLDAVSQHPHLPSSLQQHLHSTRPLQARGQRRTCIKTRTLAITLPLNYHLMHILSPVFQTESSVLSKNSTQGFCEQPDTRDKQELISFKKLLKAAFLKYSASRSDRHFYLFFIASTDSTPCYSSL